jgi:uncharacterized protein YgiM (DUF1202 family)
MADIDRSGNKNFTVGIMKTNCWLVLGLMVATSAFAQDNTTTLTPVTPAPIPYTGPPPSPVQTNAPVKKTTPKKRKISTATTTTPKKAAFVEPTVALVPGAAEVAVKNLNVRGQAGLKGEYLTHLTNGDSVIVLGEITLAKHKAEEPAQWAQIALPSSVHVWASSLFIDATNNTVSAKKLNLRAGPSENYSVLGVIERGTAISVITTKGNWTQIKPPTNAFAFVAAIYLKQEASGTVATNLPPSTETEPPVTTNNVTEPAPIVTESTNEPDATQTNLPDTSAPAITDTNAVEMSVDTNLPPPPPRVVTHEGFVRKVTSIIEPTDYELYDPKTGGEVDYLYSTTTNLDLSHYKGLHIIVTGEEATVERWKNTPLLTVQRIQVVE